ncbi:MAG: superfamily II RNA helicase [Kiritimatiellia bacterium]
MSDSLVERIPEGGFSSDDAAMDAFVEWVSSGGFSLYDAQEEAVLELFSGNHVILRTPTGSGKSLVAVALHFREMCGGRRSIYTAPIKALVSEKFLALCDLFGAANVGMMTGDGTVNRDAPIMCCTAEVLSKLALRYGDKTPFDAVVMDEFHYYGDRDRGMAWQVPLLTMPHAMFLLMSATLGSTKAIEQDLAERTGRPVTVVSSAVRPVPLSFEYNDTIVSSKLMALIRTGKWPVYAVHFTQRAAGELAQSLMSENLCTQEEKAHIKRTIRGFRFNSPYGSTLRRYILHGVGVHHAGLLPKYRLLVEKLAQQGLFKVICGTDTLGVGINVPIRTVLFTQLCKYDGEQVRIISNRSFKQVSGRAGRKGFDTEGTVVGQTPSWVIENGRLSTLISEGKKKRGKVKLKKAPTRGYKHWDQTTFDRLVRDPPEALESRFRVDHGLVLLMLQKGDDTLSDGMNELKELIEQSHSTKRSKVEMREQVDQRLDELIAAGVVIDNGPDSMPTHTVDPELQQDFSMHHSLSLYLMHVLPLLDRESREYSLDVLTMVESILEHPKVVLGAQLQRERGLVVAKLKADGVPYEERMELLDDVTYPKPRAAWIYETFNAYAEIRPWLQAEAIRPKSIVREMVEVHLPFATYIKQLRLERAEGVLLRYISQVYKTLLQNVPESFRTAEVEDTLALLRAMLARVDDSLLQTWESLLAGDPEDDESQPIDISADMKMFRGRVRAELHALVHALAAGDYDEAAESVRRDEGAWTAHDFEVALAPYIDEHGPVLFDARVRRAHNTSFQSLGPHRWEVQQVLLAPVEGFIDDHVEDEVVVPWSIRCIVDIGADTNPKGPVIQVVDICE